MSTFGCMNSSGVPEVVLILKTIENRKGDCAWSCSRWQTQPVPEKICKSQHTNQCHSLRTLYWFVLCNLQIFSGCVCHLEQLHAQSPFLFSIVFSINLIPFFDICSVDLLAVFQPGCSGMCYFCATSLVLQVGRCAVATVAVCGFGSWSLVFDCGMPRQISPLPPTPSGRSVLHDHDGRKHTWESIHTSKTVVFFTIQRSPRISTSYKFAAPRYRLPCRLYRWASNLTFQRHGSLRRAVIIKTKSLPISATTFRTALSLYIAHDGRKHKHNPTLSANKHVLQICRSSLSAAADGLADGSGERRTSPLNGIELKIAQSCRKVVPNGLRYHASNSVVFLHRTGTLAKEYPLSKLFSKVEPWPFEKEINITWTWSFLLVWSMPTKCCWVMHGSMTSERKASTSPSSFINHSTCCSIERSSAKLLVFTCTSKFERSTGSERVDALVYAPSR